MPGIVYSLQVGLSTQTPSGRVRISMRRGFCTDAAGNLFQRTANSSVLVHFDRTVPSVLLWTAIPESQLQLDNQVRTVQATNNLADVMIYLDFSQPVLNSSHQLQSVLQPSTGNLIATNQSSLGNRRFGFMLLSLGSVAVVTITLPENSAVTNYGTPVTQSTNVTFLYDTERPQVQLFSTSRAHTNDDFLPIVVQFTEPVFLFKPSGVTILGGDLQSFEEISETTYALVVHVMGNQVVSVTVADNQSLDIARNTNSASSTLQVRHYMRPVVSVAISSFITAGFLFTALASGALSVSSATLAAAGACSNQASGSFSAAYPSRNFLGMAGHLQIFAFSHFLAVSLPVEYYETTGGLLWLIPHVNTRQKDKDSNVTNFGNNLHTNNQVFLQKQKEKVRRNLVAETQISMRQTCLQKHVSVLHIRRSTERYWRQTKVCR
jgi:hypothetical protein